MTALLFFLFVAQADDSMTVDESIQVTFRDVRVHVTDKFGDPVEGLTADDFVLSEAGDRQEISFFEEVDLPTAQEQELSSLEDAELEAAERGEDEPRPLRLGRNVILVLDSSNMRAPAFDEMKEVMTDFIDTHIGPNDFVKLVQLDDQLIHLTSFVRSKERLFNGLANASYKGELYQRLAMQENEVVDHYANFLSPPLGSFTKKIELETEQEYYLDRLREAIRAKELTKSSYYYMFQETLDFFSHVFDQMVGAKAIYLFTGGGYVSKRGFEKTTHTFAEILANDLTSSNVTVYSYVHVPKEPVGYAQRTTGPVSLFGTTNVFSELGSTYRSSEGTILEDVTELTTAPLSITERTGGVMITANSLDGIRKSYDRFSNSVRHYYRLGYTIETPTKKTKVKVKFANKNKENRKWKLHYGKYFNPIEPFIALDTEDQQVSFSAALQYDRGRRDDLDAEWGFRGFNTDQRGYSVPVFVKVPAETFPKNGYMVGFAAFNDVGDLIDMSMARINHEGAADGFLLYDLLIPRSVPHTISGLVVDMDTGAKSNFRREYEQESTEEDELAISSVILSAEPNLQMIPVNHIRCSASDGKSRSPFEARRCMTDPLTMGRYLAKPSVSNIFTSDDKITLFFQVKNSFGPREECEIAMNLQKEGESVDTKLRITDAHEVDGDTINYVAGIGEEGLVPGEYKLDISVLDTTTGERSIDTFAFTVRQ